MRLLDLFCGSGGASEGYRRAGFTDIIGVDILGNNYHDSVYHKGRVTGRLTVGGDGRTMAV